MIAQLRKLFSNERNRAAVCCLVLALAGMLAYMPSLAGEFLYDDLYLVGANPLFKSPLFITEVFRHHLFLNSPFCAYYRPAQNLSYIIDYAIWNENAFGY